MQSRPLLYVVTAKPVLTSADRAVLLAVQAALDSGRPSGEHVLNVLSRLKAPVTSASLATTKLQLKEEPAADVNRYETLRTNPPEDRHV